jgi:hypothetical protein
MPPSKIISPFGERSRFPRRVLIRHRNRFLTTRQDASRMLSPSGDERSGRQDNESTEFADRKQRVQLHRQTNSHPHSPTALRGHGPQEPKEFKMMRNLVITARSLIVALLHAISIDHFSQCRALIRQGAPVDGRDEEGNSTFMTTPPSPNCLKHARMPLNAGATVNGMNAMGETALFPASEQAPKVPCGEGWRKMSASIRRKRSSVRSYPTSVCVGEPAFTQRGPP